MVFTFAVLVFGVNKARGVSGLLQNGGHHTVEDFSVRGKEPKDEVQIYTWRDATLRELTDLVRMARKSREFAE